jgi:eukaryotic-like serine/threonine-protein kinase
MSVSEETAARMPVEEAAEHQTEPGLVVVPSSEDAQPRSESTTGTFKRVDPFLGRTVGSFRLTRVLGRGGMGIVYLGEHPLIGSRVAVKLIHPRYSRDADVISRFFAEGLAVNVIGHPNIVQIYDLACLEGEHYYCVMEYLDGETLAQLVARKPLSFEEAAPVFVQVADALAAAHVKGVVHRDLKPENIFALPRRDGWAVKIVDFGVAKVTGRPDAGQGATGSIVGTPHFMAPEQAEGVDVDARADVYALGVTMYYAATGALPFNGGSFAEILLRHVEGKPVPPRQLRSDNVPETYEAVILKAMARERDRRFASMSECVAALQDCLGRNGKVDVTASVREPPPPTMKAFDQVSILPVHTRKDERRPARFEIRIESHTREQFQRMLSNDLSRRGMFVETNEPIPPLFTPVWVVVVASDGRAELRLPARIVRKVTPEEGRTWKVRAGMGVEFLDLDEETRRRLGDLLGELGASAATQVGISPHEPASDRARPAEDPVPAKTS